MLKIARENKDELWIHCPYHQDRNPSLLLNKTGEFAGQWKCFSCGRHGFAKDLGIDMRVKRQPKHRRRIDWYSRWIEQHKLGVSQQAEIGNPGLCKEWGVSWGTLWNYGYGFYPPDISTFPMVNENKRIIGLQQRFINGRKVCIKGSRLGIFCPQAWPDDLSVCYICEGMSDTAVAYELTHKLVIGRPNASACEEMIVAFCKKWLKKDTTIILVIDSDEAGISGAANLFSELGIKGFGNCTVLIPTGKDLREMYQKNKQETIKFLEAI